MKKLQGKVIHSPLEGGHWMFETNQGEKFQLRGGGDDLLVDGQKATIEGEEEAAGFGIGMTGPIFKVHFYELN